MRVDPDLLPNLGAAARYCDLLYEDRPGWVIAGAGVNGHFTKASYEYDHFVEMPYRWPTQRSDMLRQLLEKSAADDIFVTVLLRSAPNRRVKTSRALRGRYAWIDADPWDEERNARLASAGRPIHRVSSGGGGEHVYVDLGDLQPSAKVGDYSRKLALRFSTDTWGGENKVLRLPGTFNHKGRARGGGSRLVQWLT